MWINNQKKKKNQDKTIETWNKWEKSKMIWGIKVVKLTEHLVLVKI